MQNDGESVEVCSGRSCRHPKTAHEGGVGICHGGPISSLGEDAVAECFCGEYRTGMNKPMVADNPGVAAEKATLEPIFYNAVQDPQKWDGSLEEGAKLEGVPEAQLVTELPPKKQGLHTLFKEKDLLPINGVWFEISEVQEEQMTLKPRNFTKNFAKRNT